MYKLYIKQFEDENIVPVKEKYYDKVFSTKFNLHFKQLSKDTCQTYDSLQIQISNNEEIIVKFEKYAHFQKAEEAHSHTTVDRMVASKAIFVFSFDLEKALAFLKL